MIISEISDSEIVRTLGLFHFGEEGNLNHNKNVKVLTYKAIGGYWITKVYNSIDNPIYYVDSFGSMASYTNVSGKNISKQIENEKLKILYKNKSKDLVFKETYKTGHYLKSDHDLDFFKNGFQKQLFNLI